MSQWLNSFLRDKNSVGGIVALAVTVILMLAGTGLLILSRGASASAQRGVEAPDAEAESLQGTRDAFLQLAQVTPTPIPEQQPTETNVEEISTPTPTPTPIAVAAAPQTNDVAPVSVQQATPIPFDEDDDSDGPADAPDNPPAAYDGWAGDVNVNVAQPDYLADGRWAEIFVTVENVSVEPGIPTGYTYLENNEGGGWHLVSLYRADHRDVPQVKGDNAPLWWATVRFTDNTEWRFPTGCLYIEVLHAEGWEPIYDSEDGYNWEVHEGGGWFDCGNSHDKIPDQQFLAPGEAATVPLYVYLQHPREWLDEAPPNRQIARIEVELVRWDDGAPLGVVGRWPR